MRHKVQATFGNINEWKIQALFMTDLTGVTQIFFIQEVSLKKSLLPKINCIENQSKLFNDTQVHSCQIDGLDYI